MQCGLSVYLAGCCLGVKRVHLCTKHANKNVFVYLGPCVLELRITTFLASWACFWSRASNTHTSAHEIFSAIKIVFGHPGWEMCHAWFRPRGSTPV